MTMQWTNPVMNKAYADVADGVEAFIDKVERETGYRRGHVMPQPYVQPDLIANIEAEARGEDPPDPFESAAAANYAKLGLMPYGGDPAVDNMQRIANAPPMFVDPDAPTVLAGRPLPYVAPTLTGLIANEVAERRRGNRGAAVAAPAPGAVPPYIPPEMPW